MTGRQAVLLQEAQYGRQHGAQQGRGQEPRPCLRHLQRHLHAALAGQEGRQVQHGGAGPPKGSWERYFHLAWRLTACCRPSPAPNADRAGHLVRFITHIQNSQASVGSWSFNPGIKKALRSPWMARKRRTSPRKRLRACLLLMGIHRHTPHHLKTCLDAARTQFGEEPAQVRLDAPTAPLQVDVQRQAHAPIKSNI